MPEACVLVKGKPRVRMVPEKAAEADMAEQGAVAKEEALGSGTADPAADMFNAKASPKHSSAQWGRLKKPVLMIALFGMACVASSTVCTGGPLLRGVDQPEPKKQDIPLLVFQCPLRCIPWEIQAGGSCAGVAKWVAPFCQIGLYGQSSSEVL